MKDDLAQSLLAHIMQWDAAKLNDERFRIQLLADLKYDDYQKYSQGMRYVESLALWLKNFDVDDRSIMYNFIKENLIYISEGQMRNLVENAYLFHIMPILLNKAKYFALNKKKGSNQEENKKLYNEVVKTSLFLGLSDGSHIDVFRRANPGLSNEQICVYYDLSEDKTKEMFKTSTENICLSNSIFLLDDFSGSGISFIRKENAEWKGKIVKFLRRLNDYDISVNAIDIHILLYVSTQKAIKYINEQLEIYTKDNSISKRWTAESIQTVNPITCNQEVSFLLKKYYDAFSLSRIEDVHYKKGNIREPYMGFDCCSLPVVLFHNTPNNSFPIIWCDYRSTPLYRGLFPRVTRHKEEV
jgi:hypothetical protein